MRHPALPLLLIERLPFYYGWLVLACICCAGFSRQGPAVATLSIFVEPMTREFGWSRSALAGAVSLGGLLGAFASPLLGPVLDRRGARLVLCYAVLSTGAACMALSLTDGLLLFYLLFCVARMNWTSPFDLGIYGALNNWFVTRRAMTTAIATLAQNLGIVAMPLIAALTIAHDGWRSAWVTVGATVLIVGFVPTWLLLVRRPEDVGLVPDRIVTPADGAGTTGIVEPVFTRAEAMRTPAFWLLGLFTVLIYPVQAGVSLHQAVHLIERGIAPTTAAAAVSTFTILSSVAAFAVGFLPRRLPLRYALAACGGLMGVATVLMAHVASAHDGYVAAGMFGFGIGGILTLLPTAWGDYFGRKSFGAIRGMALTAQALAQAIGPILSAALRDWTGDYVTSLHCFTALAAAGVIAALAARKPR
ncbi:MAG: MFS transporter [Alphaproteobacteria bacterium]|nr:MFS transporter [Alphaproteobacteria bacterium]